MDSRQLAQQQAQQFGPLWREHEGRLQVYVNAVRRVAGVPIPLGELQAWLVQWEALDEASVILGGSGGEVTITGWQDATPEDIASEEARALQKRQAEESRMRSQLEGLYRRDAHIFWATVREMQSIQEFFHNGADQ